MPAIGREQTAAATWPSLTADRDTATPDTGAIPIPSSERELLTAPNTRGDSGLNRRDVLAKAALVGAVEESARNPLRGGPGGHRRKQLAQWAEGRSAIPGRKAQ